MAICLAAIVFLAFRATASLGPYVEISNQNGAMAYTAHASEDKTAERWKYVIRDDDTCDGTIFVDNGRGAGNFTEVVYGSNSFSADNELFSLEALNDSPWSGKETYGGRYICFNALLDDGGWQQVGSRMDFLVSVGSHLRITAGELLDGGSFSLRTYTAHADSGRQVEKWRYVLRDDDVCNGSIFEDGGRQAGNLTEVVYDGDSYQVPDDKKEASLHYERYLCFTALVDGQWQHLGAKITALGFSSCLDPDARANGAVGCPDLPDGDDENADSREQPAETDRAVSDIGFPHADDVVWKSDDEVIADFVTYGHLKITSVGYGLPDDRPESCDNETAYDFSNDVDGEAIVKGFTYSGDTYRIVRYELRISPESGVSEATGICFRIKYETSAISIWGTPDD